MAKRDLAFSDNYYTVNVVYSLPSAKRREFHDLMKRVEPDLYKKTQTRMTKPQAEALAELLRRWDIPVEINETSDLNLF